MRIVLICSILLVVLGILLLVGGCTSELRVGNSVPTPVVVKVPEPVFVPKTDISILIVMTLIIALFAGLLLFVLIYQNKDRQAIVEHRIERIYLPSTVSEFDDPEMEYEILMERLRELRARKVHQLRG